MGGVFVAPVDVGFREGKEIDAVCIGLESNLMYFLMDVFCGNAIYVGIKDAKQIGWFWH